jgi:cell division protein FtsI (penicillin-binding protein 3)
VALPVAKSIIDGLLVIEKIPPSGQVKSAQTDTSPP